MREPEVKNDPDQYYLSVSSHLFASNIVFVTDADIEGCIERLIFLASKSKSVDLYILLERGEPEMVLALHENMMALKQRDTKISTFCFGCITTLGALLLASGSSGLRKTSKNSIFLLSDDFIKDKKSPDEFMLAQKYRELFSDLIIEKLEPRMRKQSFSLDKREIWDAKTAISYGLADELV